MKVLNQEEIDAMVRAARSGAQTEARAEAGRSRAIACERWDARRAGQIGREQLQAINLLHEGFARNLTNSLGAYLRVVFAATLVSAEHLSYREFLQRMPEMTYLSSLRLEPLGAQGALQLDLKIAFPMIDLLLGGQGSSAGTAREITEIEEQILESVARIVCRELGTAWQALPVEVSFDQRLALAEAQRLMPPEEKILSLSFEVTLSDTHGGLHVALPASVSNALLRKISADWSYQKPRNRTDSREHLMRTLLDCPFPAELGAHNLRSRVRELSELAPGSLLLFARHVEQPASLLIADVEMFQAVPARSGRQRSAWLLDRCGNSRTEIRRNKL